MSNLLGGGGGDSGAAQAQLAAQQAENERLRKQTEEEKRGMAEQLSSQRMARARGGARMLLSDARTNPEEGLGIADTLGG